MIYIFLTFTMQFAGGSPLYVANKMRWLREKGWQVVVFDHYGALNMLKDIDMPEFVSFKENRLLELFFPPSYFTKKQRNTILNRLIKTIGYAKEYVVETNSTRLALWGELLAQKLNAKHLILDVNEHPDIRSKEEFEFFKYKLKRNEFFCISSRAVQLLFNEYCKINDDEAEKHVFTAVMDTKMDNSSIEALSILPVADFKILSFGRYKPYFDKMIDSVLDFSKKYSTKKINLIFMGDVSEEQVRKSELDTFININIAIIPSMRPVPKVIFDYADVVIATAGCAFMASEAGVKTISMDVETGNPLGILGYTTNDTVFNEASACINHTVFGCLESVLVKKECNGHRLIPKKECPYGYEFQMRLINDDRAYWGNVVSIAHDKSIVKRVLEKIVIRLNLINIFSG